MPTVEVIAGAHTNTGIPVDCGNAGSTVRNAGSSTVYYSDESPVSAAVNDGAIAPGSTTTLYGTVWLAVAADRTSVVVAANASTAITASRGVGSVLDYGAKGDLAPLSGLSITSGTTALSSTGHSFTQADVGKGVLVPNAGLPYSDQGSWTAGVTYSRSDRPVVLGPDGLVIPSVPTPGTTIFNRDDWSRVPSKIPELQAKIASVSAGVATLDTTAGATVSAQSGGWFATDDTAAFTAAIATNRQVAVPAPAAPAVGYCIQNVRALGVIAPELGVKFRLPFPQPTGAHCCFWIGDDTTRTDAAIIAGPSFTFDLTSQHPTGLPTKQTKGIWITGVKQAIVRGARGLNLPEGNVITTYGKAAGVPQHLIFENIVAEGAPFGFGAVQVDACDLLEARNIETDQGDALRIETDSDTYNVVRKVRGGNIKATATPENGAGNAVKLVAHDKQIMDVELSGIYGEGGANGVVFAWTLDVSKNPTGSIKRVRLRGIHVEGGGRLLHDNFGNDFHVRDWDWVISDSDVDGSNVVNPYLTAPNNVVSGCVVPAGAKFDNVKVRNGLGDGFKSVASTTGVKSGKAKFNDCEAFHNKTRGFYNATTEQWELRNSRSYDDPAFETPGATVLTANQADMVAASWGSGTNGTASVSRVTSPQRASLGTLRVVPTGTQTTGSSQTASGTSADAITASAFYKAIVYLQPSTTLTSQNGTLKILWYTSAGAFISSSTSGQVGLTVSQWNRLAVSAQAPSNAAFAAIEVGMQSDVTIAASDIWYASELTMGLVAGVAVQSYGARADTGCEVVLINSDLLHNAAGPSTGAGTFTTPGEPLLATHIAATSGAHAASAITFTPAGSIAATDVQAALVEVAAEAGGGVVPLAVADSPVVRLAADLTAITSSVTLVDAGALKFPIGSSATEQWMVEGFLIVQAANNTHDLKLGWSYPTGLTMVWGGLPGNTGNVAGFGTASSSQTPVALLAESATLGVGTAAAKLGVMFMGTAFGGGNAGDLQLRWAQLTSDAGAVQLLKGSWMRARRIAS